MFPPVLYVHAMEHTAEITSQAFVLRSHSEVLTRSRPCHLIVLSNRSFIEFERLSFPLQQVAVRRRYRWWGWGLEVIEEVTEKVVVENVVRGSSPWIAKDGVAGNDERKIEQVVVHLFDVHFEGKYW